MKNEVEKEKKKNESTAKRSNNIVRRDSHASSSLHNENDDDMITRNRARLISRSDAYTHECSIASYKLNMRMKQIMKLQARLS